MSIHIAGGILAVTVFIVVMPYLLLLGTSPLIEFGLLVALIIVMDHVATRVDKALHKIEQMPSPTAKEKTEEHPQ